MADRDEVIEAMNDTYVRVRLASQCATREEAMKAALARAEELNHKLLPREPSEEMIEASSQGHFETVWDWRAMWDAAGEKP